MNSQRFCRGHARTVPAPGADRAKSIIRHAGLALCLAAASGFALTGCTSGDGGSNGNPDYESSVDNATGLLFSYPYNGQQNVTLTSQIALRAASSFDGQADGAFRLQAGSGDEARNTDITVTQDDDQPGIYRIDTSQPLRGSTTYRIVAARNLTAGNTTFDSGDVLFQFTTAPAPGRPAAGAFRVTEASPGETNPATGRTSVFAQFNTVHVSLSETIDPTSVVDGDSFRFTNSDGDEVRGALTVSGHEITFDPAENLAPGTYTLALTDDVKSAFGKSLRAFNAQRTVLDSGKIVQQNLLVDNDEGFSGDADDSILDGQMDNLVTLRNQLIGVNQQPARNQPARQGVLSNLATPGMPGFGDVFPNSIPAGQVIQLKPLSVRLNGDIQTPVNSGPIQVQFGTDANVYLMSNDYRSITTPTAVRLRFDLNNTTLISAAPGTPEYIVQALANGVFNQSALNIQASGLAIPQDNGDLVISTVGTFPLTVNRTDDLTIDFSLTLRLPESTQTPVQSDDVPPFITAQVPSACLYTFGTPAYDALYAQRGVAPTVLPEQACVSVLNAGSALNTTSGISDFQVEGSPALVFSEPIDPLSVNSDSIQFNGPSGTVDVSYQIDGSSVVLHPADLLEPDTQYTITLNGGDSLRDLGGNDLVPNQGGGPGQTISFTTEPRVDNNPAPALLGELTPGIPCALDTDRGDFRNGGDTAGQCAGDADNGTTNDLAVFSSPRNVPVNASFSKFVRRDSVVLADGCLTGGSGDSNSVDGATVALEQIDGSGQCTGVPEARLAFFNTRSDLVRGFSIRPVDDLEVGSRYWVVVCGDQNSVCSRTIVDADGLALNTDPLNGTGSTVAPDDAAGGPDIIVPFDATAYSADYYADQFTLPTTDTNGNGQFDDADGNGVYDSGDERPQASNRSLVALSLLGQQITNSDQVGQQTNGAYPSYLSLTRPVAIRKTQTNCGDRLSGVVTDDGDSAVGETPQECIQVSLLPGGISALTGIGISLNEALPGLSDLLGTLAEVPDQTPIGDIPVLGPLLSGTLNGVASTVAELENGLNQAIGQALQGGGTTLDPINTGRILLRFPDLASNGDDDAGTQSGYIIPKCEGTRADGSTYDYEPCFATSLNLVANAPDGQGVTLDQQDFTINLVGPVSFQQNGRLVISLRNVNTVNLQAQALGLLPAAATINPGALNFQLTGNEAHGGRAFPSR
ncbi:Ig-like domain-containing protein [Salinisphaera sp. Q1T1-3]|uniref:Ig-like domain-containing protein n=1 Tax=Salinisphaera sp. Q1T1-3 TaxID=2321229 RepID=UPI000E745EBB|nr:Ig-like domain-containing protein [Salinisphaera sp. Q1T1-3]RJS94375.1 hypothetical protein D3260_04520 [Salinisphaera sp. Q1T1-3]